MRYGNAMERVTKGLLTVGSMGHASQIAFVG